MNITLSGFTDYPEFESFEQFKGFKQELVQKGFAVIDSTTDNGGGHYPEMKINFKTETVEFFDNY